MGDLSIIEFVVYGLICYTGSVMLIKSAFAPTLPTDSVLTTIRVIFLIPSIIGAGILASSGINITTEQTNTSNLIKDLNNTNTWQETTTQINKFVLINPVWITFHFLLFIVMLVYVIQQVLILFDGLKKNRNKLHNNEY